MEKKNRIISIFFIVMILFVMLYSALFIVAEADHDCVGENCPICYQISICEYTLKNLSLYVCSVAFAAAFTYILCGSTPVCAEATPCCTLVSLKVKLSD